MRKIDPEFKKEVDEGVQEGRYAARKIFVPIIIGIVVLCIVFGGISIASRFVGRNADRVIHKQSLTYNEGVLDDLAKYRLEMQRETDPTAKTAIAEMVNSRFANFDETKIENDDLKQFLKECRNGDY